MRFKTELKSKWLIFIFACFLLAVVLLSVVMTQALQPSATDACIRCHISVYNQGLANSSIHAPFWERQCDLCHLASGSQWVETTMAISELEQITGTVVTQELLWRKPQIFSSQPDVTFDHLVDLSGLTAEDAYRIRIQLQFVATTSDESILEGQWIGLRPSELSENTTVPLNIDTLIPVAQAGLVTTASLSWDGKTVFVTLQTSQLMTAQVEVQDLDGLNLNSDETSSADSQSVSAQEQHPPMRSAEALAIEACYQCHSEADLGTSHPVRLFSGKDVRIPDELPTVDGMLTCVTCHDPHGSDGEMLVREVIKTKLCVTCHYKYKNSSPSTMFQ